METLRKLSHVCSDALHHNLYMGQPPPPEFDKIAEADYTSGCDAKSFSRWSERDTSVTSKKSRRSKGIKILNRGFGRSYRIISGFREGKDFLCSLRLD